jgi:ubiquinone/menaquinone biosynthesis C-methylase UbiE
MIKTYSSDLEPLLQRISLNRRQVVDVGCGDADKAKALVKSGATVIGIEPDLESWQVGEIEKDGFKLVRGSAQEMPVENDSADVVIFMYSLHHVPTEFMKDALSEARRVLKDTGILYIAEPIAGGGFQLVCESFLDETQIRQQAIRAIESYLMPEFGQCDEFEYDVPEVFDDFTQFADEMVRHALNRYDRSDVDSPLVRARFQQCLKNGRFHLDHPVRVWVFYNLNGA